MSQTDQLPIQKERQVVHGILGNLLRAIKSYSLYPAGHDNRKKPVERTYNDLKVYLHAHKILSLEIGKDRLVFDGETLFSAPVEQGNLPFVLFRDGIQALEFHEGIDGMELESFLGILDRYWILTDEPEGDLVTALWDAQLPHIRYVVSDIFWGVEPETDLGAFSLGKPSEDGAKVSQSANGNGMSTRAMADPFETTTSREAQVQPSTWKPGFSQAEWVMPIDSDAVELTPEESETLFEWVIQEEEKDPTPNFLNAVFDSLLEMRDTKDFEVVFDTLTGIFQNLLERGGWDAASRLLEEVGKVDGRCQDPPPDLKALIESFFKQVSASPILGTVEKNFLKALPQELEPIKKMLLLLTPDAIPTLCRILAPGLAFESRRMLLGVIEVLASRDVRPLESMLDSPEGDRIQRLVSILGRLQGEKIEALLRGMLHHFHPVVRREAATALLRRNAENIKEVFSLIEDDDEVVRRLVLGFVSRFRDPVLEDMMLGYLRNESVMQGNPAHVLACFRALGFCGSSRSVPFLEQILKHQGWMDLFRSKHRYRGAVSALKSIGTLEARKILEKTGRSLIPGIRRAATQALKDWTAQ